MGSPEAVIPGAIYGWCLVAYLFASLFVIVPLLGVWAVGKSLILRLGGALIVIAMAWVPLMFHWEQFSSGSWSPYPGTPEAITDFCETIFGWLYATVVGYATFAIYSRVYTAFSAQDTSGSAAGDLQTVQNQRLHGDARQPDRSDINNALRGGGFVHAPQFED